MRLEEIPISDIVIPERFRKDYGNIVELSISIKEDGFIQPIAVVVHEAGFRLLAGGRRIKAAEQLGLEKIPARIFPEGLEELSARSIELAENIYRKNLTIMEEVMLKEEIFNIQTKKHGTKEGMPRTLSAPGFGQDDLGKMFNQSKASMSRDLKLAKACRVIPGLSELKTKNEMEKVINKLATDARRSELAARLEDKTRATPEDIYKKNLVSKYVLMDFLEGVRQVPDESVNFIEMDSPYGIDLPVVKKASGVVTSSSDYTEITPEKYAVNLPLWLAECYRVMTPHSWIVVWFGVEPWFGFVLQTMRNVGFSVRGMPAIWVKGGGQATNPPLYLASTYDMFFYGRKGKATIVKQGRNNVFDYRPVASQRKINPAERPIEMLQEIITVFCEPGSNIMVPFLGSGNTLLAAANLNMNAFGFELVKEYRDAFALRAFDGGPGTYSSY